MNYLANNANRVIPQSREWRKYSVEWNVLNTVNVLGSVLRT